MEKTDEKTAYRQDEGCAGACPIQCYGYPVEPPDIESRGKLLQALRRVCTTWNASCVS